MTNQIPPETVIAEYEKIDITSEVAKKLVSLVKDPTGGASMELDLRNKLRAEYSEDLLTAIDMLTIICHTADDFHSILAIKRKLELNITKSV